MNMQTLRLLPPIWHMQTDCHEFIILIDLTAILIGNILGYVVSH